MPRIRTIKPDTWQDEKVTRLSVCARLLMIGLITQADDDGRLRASPALLRAQVFPCDESFTSSQVEGWRDELIEVGILVHYEVGEDRYLSFPNWQRHQRINRPTESVFPAPDEGSVIPHGSLSEPSVGEGKGRERKGKERNGREGSVRGGESAIKLADAPLSHLLADLVLENGSKLKFDPLRGVPRTWAEAEGRMLKLDERDFDEAELLVRWCQADSFWRGNVLSMPKFRERYDQLRLQAQRNGRPKEHPADRRIRERLAAA